MSLIISVLPKLLLAFLPWNSLRGKLLLGLTKNVAHVSPINPPPPHILTAGVFQCSPCIQALEHDWTMSLCIINSFSVVLKVHILFSSERKHPAWGWGSSSGSRPGKEKRHIRSSKTLLPFPAWESRRKRTRRHSDWKRRSLSLPPSHCLCNRCTKTVLSRKTPALVVCWNA